MNFKKNAKLCPEVSSQNCLEVENHRPERLETSRQLLQWWPGKGPKLLKKTEGKVFAPATAKQVLDYISVYLYVQCTPGLMYTYIYLLAHTSMYFLYIYTYICNLVLKNANMYVIYNHIQVCLFLRTKIKGTHPCPHQGHLKCWWILSYL